MSIGISNKDASVYVESISPIIGIKYGKRHFLKVDLKKLIYAYFSSIKEAVPMGAIKAVFQSGGVDLDLKVVVKEGEQIYLVKK